MHTSPAGILQEIRYRGVAQSGSARALGAWGRGFESLHPDSNHLVRGSVVKRPKTPPFHGGYPGSNPGGVTFSSFPIWAFSSVGQSGRLITGWSGVQVPEGPQPFPGPVAQLVRAPACHAGGRGFEPHPGRTFLQLQSMRLVGCAGVAQSVEQLICNQQVAGSSPIASSIPFRDNNFIWMGSRVAKGSRL